MKKKILELRDIHHRFPDSGWELNFSSFTLFEGEILVIIGPNGSGKSTLLRLAAGIISPLKGSIRLENKELKTLKRRKIAKLLGYLPQELGSQYDYTVEELVAMGRYSFTNMMGILNNEDMKIIEKTLLLTGLLSLRQRHLSSLSGGERKRAFLASVLAQEPKVLLLDEPTTALDLHFEIHFFHLLRELARKNIGIAIVTHDVNLGSLFADRLIVMKEGKILAEGGVTDILTLKTLHSIYGDEILIEKHPQCKRPIILPRILAER